MDDKIIEKFKSGWEKSQELAVERAYQFFLENPPPKDKDLFKEWWYAKDGDKKGKKHAYNMFMSISQTWKADVGNSFEKIMEEIFEEMGILAYSQVWVDDGGIIYTKKPKGKEALHKVDFIIPLKLEAQPTNTKDCCVISVKTKLRERWRQDLNIVPHCNKLVILTREQPNETNKNNIMNHGAMLIYPNATEFNYTYLINFLQDFQK
jgi:hypothetical protein